MPDTTPSRALAPVHARSAPSLSHLPSSSLSPCPALPLPGHLPHSPPPHTPHPSPTLVATQGQDRSPGRSRHHWQGGPPRPHRWRRLRGQPGRPGASGVHRCAWACWACGRHRRGGRDGRPRASRQHGSGWGARTPGIQGTRRPAWNQRSRGSPGTLRNREFCPFSLPILLCFGSGSPYDRTLRLPSISPSLRRHARPSSSCGCVRSIELAI